MADPIASQFDDPRITPRFVEHVETDDGVVTLVGVVHDHPASVARVRTLVAALEPAVLALELPSVALPLYRAYARDGRRPPRLGGEMSAAIQVSSDARVVGIDAPSWSFLRQLVSRLVEDRVPVRTARRALAGLGHATGRAVACRLAATVTNATSATISIDSPVEYECDHADSPERQATHERAHVAAVQALIGDRGNRAVDYRDETRERVMVERLRPLREDGPVLAVVGVDHLDPVATALRECE